MRLGILTQYYPPEIGAPQARLSGLAERFVQLGHDVRVVTALPSYPLGRIYPGYRRLGRIERQKGVTVTRTLIYPTKSPSVLPRLCNYFSFAISAVLEGGWSFRKLDFLLTESPPLFLGPSGYLLSRLTKARWIFNVSDLWPESLVHLGAIHNGISLSLCNRLEAFCYQHSWLVSGQSREIVQNIQERFPRITTYHLSNGADTSRFTPNAAISSAVNLLRDRARCVAIYAGLHGVAQGLIQIVDAARLLNQEDFRIVLVGDGPEKTALQQHAQFSGVRNIRFLDALPPAEMPALLASADMALVVLKTDLPGAVPSKLYEAMASGLPIVLAANGEPAQIVKHYRAGIVVNPGDAAGLAGAMQTLYALPALRRELGGNGRRAAVEHFDRGNVAARFIEYLKSSL